ncbi:cbb3-type cytochrome c oxidase subunit I [Ancylobacter dichloromethanicus]
MGLWYTGASFFFFLFAGVLALIIRARLAVPGNDLVSPGTYNQLFTLHGTMMMFLFAVPIFEAVAILILPQMLAARDLPFPRLSAFGFWCFLIGGVFVGGSILFNAAPDSGWFMYPPLATDTEQTGIGADIWLLGLSFIEIASIAAAVEPDRRRAEVPPARHAHQPDAALRLVRADRRRHDPVRLPPLIAGDILFEMQRLFDWPFFDAARGGDPVLWQHLFWIFGHPEVYIIFLPSIALLAMIVPTFARRPILGYGWIVLAAVGTGFLSFGLWAHHMFTIGLPWLSLGFFSAASEAVAIPTGVQIFVFVATLLAGRAIFSIPMLFATGALAIFVFGGLTGVMVALAPFDWQAHDSYFIVAHLHYTLIGGMFFPLIAGLYYFYPFVVGRMLSARLGRWSFWLMFAGFNIAFLPMHITGLRGMPRRVYTYPEGLGWDWLNLVSTVGAFTMAAGVLVMVWDALRPGKPRAPRNPWNAGTLEWVAGDPSEPWGIRSVPPIRSRYPLWDQPNLIREIDEGKFYLPGAPEGKRETLITDVLDATPLQVLRVPGNSFKPLIAAVLIGGSFIATTFHWWLLAIASGALGIAAIMVWLWTGTAAIPEKPERGAGLGVTLPLYASGPASVGWWAMFITMVGDGTAFISLVFAYFYYWTIHPAFPPAGMAPPDGALMLGGGAAALAAWAAMLGARRANGGGHAGRVRLLIGAAALLSVAGAALLLLAPWQAGLDPVAHVYPATVWVLVLWTALHLGVGVLMQGYCLAGALAGRLTARHDIDLRNVVLYGHFAFLTVATTLAVLVLAPRAT